MANEHEEADGAGSVARGVDQNLQQGARGGADDIVDAAGHEEQDDEKDGAGEGADADADDHDFGALDGGVGDFCNGKQLQFLSILEQVSKYLQSCGRRSPGHSKYYRLGGWRAWLTKAVTPRPPWSSCMLSVSVLPLVPSTKYAHQVAKRFHRALIKAIRDKTISLSVDRMKPHIPSG